VIQSNAVADVLWGLVIRGRRQGPR
jgi:hypothetical protein